MTQGNGQPLGTLTNNPSQQPGNSGGDARPGLNGGDLRQIRNQANQLAGDVQQLRQQMQTGGADAGSLRSVDEVVRGLRDIGSDRGSANPQSLDALMSQALDRMQKVEYDLRKRIDTENQQLFLSGSDEVPTQFRKSVEDYYKALSNRKNGTQPAAAPTAPAKGKGRGK